MRSNPLFVDRLLPGGEIFCRGHAQGGSVGKRDHTLHRPLAESRFADKQCTAGVLERTRHNFRPARARTVDQHRDRISPRLAPLARGKVAALGRSRTALGVGDQRPARQEFARHLHRAGKQAARIETQIDDQGVNPLLLQLVERAREFPARWFAELRDPDVADPRTVTRQDACAAHTRNLDHLALDLELQRFRRPLAPDGQLYRRPRLAAQFFHRIAQGHLVGRLSVDFQQHVARKQAGPKTGRALHRRDNGQPLVFQPDDNSQAAELAPRILLHALEILRVHEITVRIQVGQHSTQRTVDQLLVLRFVLVDIVLTDQLDRPGQGFHLPVGRNVLLFLRGHRTNKAEHGEGRGNETMHQVFLSCPQGPGKPRQRLQPVRATALDLGYRRSLPCQPPTTNSPPASPSDPTSGIGWRTCAKDGICSSPCTRAQHLPQSRRSTRPNPSTVRRGRHHFSMLWWKYAHRSIPANYSGYSSASSQNLDAPPHADETPRVPSISTSSMPANWSSTHPPSSCRIRA